MSIARKPPLECSIAECGLDVRATKGNVTKQLCGKHNMRVARHGDPTFVMSRDQWRLNCRAGQLRTGKCQPHTYPKFLGRHLHRVIAELKLGRPLLPGETVHHKDENKHNASEDNLEVLANQSVHARRHRFGQTGQRRRR